MDLNTITKHQAQYAGYMVFVIVFVVSGFSWIMSMGYQSLMFVPAVFLLGMIGFWLGGFLHNKFLNNDN
ncbi:MAG: hypothetical protein K8R64_02185 [Methanosarcinaceae archaeon]|nr:hypothetical protein [Methanosarcinaceae archaeon]